MNNLEYCDLDIMSQKRILLRIHINGKYILRDFNDQILVGTTVNDHVYSKSFLMFGYRMIMLNDAPEIGLYDCKVKKI